MELHDFQKKLVSEIRESLRKRRSVTVQLPTGGGKSHIAAAIIDLAWRKGIRVWICVPRNDLIWQFSQHLRNRDVPHGIIAAGRSESPAYHVHVISIETIKRRISSDRIRNYPGLMMFDECHIQLDAQERIVSALPPKTKIIGFSATPERLDGRGLGVSISDKGKKTGLYEGLVQGPDIGQLIDRGYLSSFKYFCPPLEGLDQVHRKGTEYDPKELDALFKRRAVYGKAIEHYREYGAGKRCLVFCRSVKSAEETARKFREAGYRFASIDGKMSDMKRKGLIKSLQDGELQGLTNCEIVTYGIDIPAVEIAIMLRPTLSVALYMQMIGRVLRRFPGKKEAIILDHVNNLSTHFYPLERYEWQFFGTEKKKGKKRIIDMHKLCPRCYMYYTGNRCNNCGSVRPVTPAAKLMEIDGKLVEIKEKIPLAKRSEKEKESYNLRIDLLIRGYYETKGIESVSQLCALADDLGYSSLWVYHRLNTDSGGVNIDLLKQIAAIKKYKPGWIYHKQKELRRRISA